VRTKPIRFCPVTGNQPTILTERAFKIVCNKAQARFREKRWPYSDWCEFCHGDHPAELTIKPLNELVTR
jgi:hypothetical protein